MTRVVHVNSHLSGGAARGAYWLHQALRAAGVDSSFLSRPKEESALAAEAVPDTLGWQVHQRVSRRLYRLLRRLKHKDRGGFWSLQLVPNTISETINEFGADLVHLHWVGREFVPIASVPRIEAPLVWTIRDMWPFTGGCHYSEQCSGYHYQCGACPQLRGDFSYDLSHLVWRWKKHCWRDLDVHLVAPSEWMADCIRASSLLRDYPVRVIPNGVSLDTFYPEPAAAARRKLGLPVDGKLVLFGAMNARESRKGGRQLLEALERIAQTSKAEDISVVVFGQGTPLELPLPSVHLGYIDNDERLRLAYSAADVMVVPSLEEAFGKTVIEAMACQTPVVAFNTGGPADIIAHRENGFLAPTGHSERLAEGILWCLEEDERLARLSEASLETAQFRYGIRTVASEYTELYEEILSRRGG
ncbi:glycosyltransferase [Persicimonas caeni]|uniref:Glycosyltransferase n=1 Tax=Persicimonas caeni TaxID=2292766 RepID=A0A4Y6PTY7_PERCE|nr:glycosyltransferase family 4 protein [Persicimonas caeni]QDG51703.1 glycosyltransferase [Persicimonas caeni]QED32924.1 glycosyltransferase [Persicimonas caeni]